MANIAHSLLSGANLHEPKGISTATTDTVYVANGDGLSGVWQKIVNTQLNGVSANGTSGASVRANGAGGFVIGFADHGDVTFVNTASPYAMTGATTSFTKCAPTTVGSGHSIEVTEATTARLTYIGADVEHFSVHGNVSVDQATGSDKDISIAFAKNGVVVTSSEQVHTTTSSKKVSITSFATVLLTTNDYVELFVKISSAATVNVYCFSLSIGAM